MKVAHPLFTVPIELEDGIINILVVENQKVFSSLIVELLEQQDNEDGDFFFSHQMQELKIARSVDIIINYFDFGALYKRMQTKIFALLTKKGNNAENFIETQEMLAFVSHYIAKYTEDFDYPLTYEPDLELSAIWKIANVRIAHESGGILENLRTYLLAAQELLSIQCFVLVNLKTFLSDAEQEAFFKELLYRKISVLLIESTCYEKCFSFERYRIIDKDLCEIV